MTNVAQGRGRRRVVNTVKDAIRGLRTDLALLNRRISGRLDLRDGDLDLLELIARLGPLGPSALARHAGLHPATMTGVLDRLEKGGWLTRERDPQDRRSVTLRIRRERVGEIFTLYSGMNQALDDICAGYTDEELLVIADFLSRAATAGQKETKSLER
ncbi:MarR family transcriptional regulator [Actinophytocola oryzae]|uniref:DNA-binding MarR family transcriptional regulator n=1 Tax=Actinophytocola oryzae TaxID=502181 RepID=A0A4R7VRJ6_9PSEU|nr:MarR family transcriptional regulator [Actinophytocola oryzae]TDV52354.1 DNA-binding MarR family transcriptional regulator [Actinophytocola oryzae]